MSQAKPASSVFEQWFDAVRNAWAQWSNDDSAVSGASWVQHLEQANQANLDGAERLVRGSIRTQSEWLSLCRQSLRAQQSTPEHVAQWAESWLAMCDQSLEARERLWDQWLSTARQLDASALQQWIGGPLNQQGTVGAWNELARQAIEQQKQLLSTFLGAEQPVSEPIVEVAVDDATAAAVEAMTAKKTVRANAGAARRTA